MSNSARIILFTSDEANAPELRRQITAVPRAKIVAELDEPSLLGQAVSQFPADVLIVDIDRATDVVLECLSQLSQGDCSIPIFALSQSSQGDIILRAMRSGVKEYLIKPLQSEELSQALARSIVVKATTKEPGTLITVLGSAGGVGGSTVAVNLAVELAGLLGEGKRVALVDLDFRFGQVATMLDVHGQFTVGDLCSTPEQLDPEMILKALVKHETGVHVLSRPHSFSQAELITAAHAAAVLTGLQDLCEYVVVDGPTRYDAGGRSVLDAADHNLLILQLLVTSVRNADRMIQELGAQGFNTDRISLVCNRMGRESAHLEIDHVEQTLNRKIYATIPDDWKAVSSSVNIGKPLCAEFARTRVRQSIVELASKLHDPAAAAAADAGGRGGLIGKLFKMAGRGSAPTEEAPPVAAAPAR